MEIRVVQGDGLAHKAGARSKQALVVEIKDETGRPVDGALVSFRLPPAGPGGLFSNGLPSEVVITGKDGRAAVSGMRWNRVPGPFDIRVTAAKGDARTGILVAQSIAGEANEPGAARTGLGGTEPQKVALPPFKPRRRWLTPFLIAAGAAAGGVTAGFAVSRRTAAAAPVQSEQGLSVGPPSITIERP